MKIPLGKINFSFDYLIITFVETQISLRAGLTLKKFVFFPLLGIFLIKKEDKKGEKQSSSTQFVIQL